MQNDLHKKVAALDRHMLDIAEAVDQHTKAIATVYQAIQEIAKKQNIQLPKPLCKMDIESNLINSEKIYDAELAEQQVINYERN
jgi:hypothetical protein